MRFGNTSKQLKKAVFTGLIIGVLGFIFSAAMFVFYEKWPLERVIPLMLIIIYPAIIIFLAVSPTLLFSIHNNGEWVEHQFLDRWILSRARASDFVSIQSPYGFFAAAIKFADGTRMKVFGVQPRILDELEAELKK